jgi:hypothetical protein
VAGGRLSGEPAGKQYANFGLSSALPPLQGHTVVPPMSMTRTDLDPLASPPRVDKKLAPLIEFVGPELKVRIGAAAACSRVSRVPSLLVTKMGHSSSRDFAALENPSTVIAANGNREVLRIVAFSLSSKPRLAMSLEHVTKTSGSSRLMI